MADTQDKNFSILKILRELKEDVDRVFLNICSFLSNGHSDKCEVVSHCGFDLHCTDD